MTWESKPLRFGGTCQACGRKIDLKEAGWHNADIKKVRCAQCGPPDVTSEAETPVEARVMRTDPVGGSAALREAQTRRDSKWLKGATGEYLMDSSLQHRLTAEAVVLTDRRVPGTKSNIDHIVIAPSGVWIIDSKKWKGKIEYKAESLMKINMRLFVGGKDRTSSVETIYGLVIPIAQLIEDRSIPVHPALVFIEGDWSAASLPRFVMNKPYIHEGVSISPPKTLIHTINQPGPLDAESVSRIANRLDEALKPR